MAEINTNTESPVNTIAARWMVLSESDIATQYNETFIDSTNGNLTWKTLFSSGKTPTNSLCTGIAVCPPLSGHLCSHKHAQAEVYFIIEGQGMVKVDGNESKVQAGTVVFIPGNAEHAIWNLGEGALRWLYVFPTDAFEDVVYQFS